MKSTGEVMGIGRTYSEALFKAIHGANMRIPEKWPYPHDRSGP